MEGKRGGVYKAPVNAYPGESETETGAAMLRHGSRTRKVVRDGPEDAAPRQERPGAEEASAAAWLSRIWGCAVSPASTIPVRAGRPAASERSLARGVGEDERETG